ncbi:MAG: hypothetical protein CM1200mP35_07630 [Chloroflexota bacterium]|nr:MAG: hypothetical protein CM1200mP35_07630 [Chloroflexota bacterium]
MSIASILENAPKLALEWASEREIDNSVLKQTLLIMNSYDNWGYRLWVYP